MAMKTYPVTGSSMILEIRYDDETAEMDVVLDRGTYHYSNVPLSTFEAFMRAPSKGRFYNEFIKGGF